MLKILHTFDNKDGKAYTVLNIILIILIINIACDYIPYYIFGSYDEFSFNLLLGGHKKYLWPVSLFLEIIVYLVLYSIYTLWKRGIHLWVLKWVWLYITTSCSISFLSLLIFTKIYNLKMDGERSAILSYLFNINSYHLETQLALSVLSGFCLTAVLGMYVYLAKHDKSTNPFGNARFASMFDIWRAGFLKKKGIIVGERSGSLLNSSGFEHVLVFAPTGSGKTRSISIPNLLTWKGSCIVNDVKGTLFSTTSKYRQDMLGNDCFVWAPASVNTHRYNPLSFISNDKIERVKDIQRIAHIFIPDGRGDLFWYQSCRELFIVMVLYVLDDQNSPATFAEISRIVKRENFNEWLEEVLDHTDHFDPMLYRNGYSYLNVDSKTRSNILKTFTGYFEIFDDPVVDAATSESDFDISQLRSKQITIYVVFTDDDMERLSQIITVFWQQVISTMIREIPDTKDEPYDLLCLIDEFSSMGRIEKLRRTLKLLREYRVRCVIILQYIGQTFEMYNHDEAKAFTNIKTKVAFAQDSHEDAKYISELMGHKTQKVHSGSSTVNANQAIFEDSKTKSYSFHSIPLMRPEEIMRMKEGRAIIIKTGYQPILAGQCIWYKSKLFKNRTIGESAVPVQRPQQVKYIRNLSDESKVHDEVY